MRTIKTIKTKSGVAIVQSYNSRYWIMLKKDNVNVLCAGTKSLYRKKLKDLNNE